MRHTETLYFIHTRIVPAALAQLPAKMDSVEARAMLLAIGLQESKFEYRLQIRGPARGYWQFEEMGGVKGVLLHPYTRDIVLPVLKLLDYRPATTRVCYEAIAHNDVLAAVFARLLLWTVPGALPSSSQAPRAWTQYLSGWRPGKPHPETWEENFREAWRTVVEETE